MSKQKFWFVVGSQHLYGEEALTQVKENAQKIVNHLNKSELSFEVELYDELAVTADTITKIMKEVNYQDDVQGVITWMHTFSPAKMWIRGTKLLQKPLLHLVTQFNEDIPWDTIDMDYMNLHQSAHGDREYGYINKRLGINNKVIVGYWKDEHVIKDIEEWMNVAYAYNESFNIKVARFGDNMRNVAVTDGDKIEAQIKFGWTVDYYAIGDLVALVEQVSEEEVNNLLEEYREKYDFELRDIAENDFIASVKEQIKYEVAIEKFLIQGGYSAFTSNFEDLYGMKQLPGLAVQRLNEKGFGFAGEGDWKTAALDRFMKIIAKNEATGFMEDYTYNMSKGNELILGSHMLEVDPTLSNEKPKIVVQPLGIGGKDDPARMVFDGKTGEGIVATLIDDGDDFKLIINDIEAVSVAEKAPKLPVARVIWKVKPDFKNGVKQWIENGGGHHTVLSLKVTKSQLITFANLVDLDFVVIGE
ncbi:L-arabinose isomerase [Macrococcoides goetzii]|uniref:L-arabinose isomerase n=1 Tax=Macrococcoides goetzii TaxID=1891097 RepID=A0A395G9I5_9STAP|nr:L-arabinose isomerase [Macrococcus goetzii]RAI80660.1 L-arabinose isomerase [Macrococcus goetzii]